VPVKRYTEASIISNQIQNSPSVQRLTGTLCPSLSLTEGSLHSLSFVGVNLFTQDVRGAGVVELKEQGKNLFRDFICGNGLQL